MTPTPPKRPSPSPRPSPRAGFGQQVQIAFRHDASALFVALAVAINADFFWPMLAVSAAFVAVNVAITALFKTKAPSAFDTLLFVAVNGGFLAAVPLLIEKNAPFWLMGIYAIAKAMGLWRQQQVGQFVINSTVLVIAAATPYAYFNIKDEGLLTGVLVLGFLIVLWVDQLRRNHFIRSKAMKSAFATEHAYDGIIELNLMGKVVGANPAAAQICTASGRPQSLYGRSFMSLLSLKTKTQTIATLKRLFGDEQGLTSAVHKQVRGIETLSLQPDAEGGRLPLTVACRFRLHVDPVSLRRTVIVYIQNNESLDALKKDNEKQHLKIISLSKLASIGETAEGISDELHKQLTMTQSRMLKLGKIITSEEFSQKKAAEATLQGIASNLSYAIKAVQVFSKNRTSQPYSYENLSGWLRDVIDTGSFHLRHKNLEVIYDEADTDLSIKQVFCQKDRLTQGFLQVFRMLAEQVIESSSCHILLATRMAGKDLWISFSIIESPGQPMGTLGMANEASLDLAREVIEDHSGTIQCNGQSLKDIVTIRLPVADKLEEDEVGSENRFGGDAGADAEPSTAVHPPKNAA